MRRALIASLVSVSVSLPAAAQPERPGLFDVLSIDNILQRLVQSGIIALRSQLDLQYEHLSFDLVAGQTGIVGLHLWPLLDYDDSGECEILADRITLSSAPITDWNSIEFSTEIIGLRAHSSCLDRDMKQAYDATGLEWITLDRAYLDMRYDVPSAAASVALHAVSPDLIELDGVFDFSYVSVDARPSLDEPIPVVFVENARVEVNDRGLWARIAPLVPEELQSPTIASAAIVTELTKAISDWNGSVGAPTTLSEHQQNFVLSVGTAAAGFLTTPGRLVIEIDPVGEDVFLDEALFNDPQEIFAELRPAMSRQPAIRQEILADDILRVALGLDEGTLDSGDLMRAGRALLTGVGAPQNVKAAQSILGPLADRGHPGAAGDLAFWLEMSEPARAYRYALVAAAAGEDDALALADRLEAALPMSEVLNIQTALTSPPNEGSADISAFRDRALAAFLGKTETRSYASAAYWARLAAAAGDPGGASLLDDLERKMRFQDARSRAAWASLSDQIADRALNAWFNQGLAATTGAE